MLTESTVDGNLPAAHVREGEESLQRDNPDAMLQLGKWVMVSGIECVWNKDTGKHDDVPQRWLGCITYIGSNYVKVNYPSAHESASRIHFDKVWEDLEFLSDEEAQVIVQDNIRKHSVESQRLIGEVKEITLRLGLRTAGALPAPSMTGNGMALATLSAQTDVEGYKNALIVAKEKTLPDLFEAIKEENAKMTIWMTADMLPLKAMAGEMKDHIDEIKDRIFNVSLYAGLVESMEQVAEGKPADIGEKLHIMQRRCYMDEECLVAYTAGGMEFTQIGQFDAWLSEPENRDRILPFPRCLVAFRVRRFTKEREFDGTLLSAHINIRLEQSDKFTYLYIRNGEQLWRLGTEIDFDELIFPDKAAFDPFEPMMMKIASDDRIERLIPRREYDDRVAARDAMKAKHEAWMEEHKVEFDAAEWPFQPRSPYTNYDDRFDRLDEYEPFDATSVYFDEGLKLVGDEIKKYNRIALIIQGLFDRSQVLHPHMPVRTWTPEGFAQAITLVYDGTQVLHDGEAPDFDAYRRKCNESIGEGSAVVGQYDYWLRREREKERKRRQSDYRLASAERDRDLSYWRPIGNKGPEWVASVEKWKPRSRTATFTWQRERLSGDYWDRQENPIACSISVPDTELFNVSAYKPGDFKQFYRDSRTRANYLKWAPILLAAEDWWAKQGGSHHG